MHLTADNILLIGSVLLFVSLLASRTTKYGVPALVLFLLVGMLAGSEGIGGIYFNDPYLAKFIGSVALSFILFSGGLETKIRDIRPVLRQGILLSTLGVIVTTFVIGLALYLLTDFSLTEGLLLGAVVSSTDAAAVFSILRSRSIGLKGTLRPLLELESGSNDPMAYFLTIAFTFLLSHPGASLFDLVPMFFRQMVFGAAIGYGMGVAMHRVINWIRLGYDGLYFVLLISLMLFTFSFTSFVGGNPFLAVYLSAIILGNRDFIHKRGLTRHFDGQAWVMQVIMFISLGLLVFPSQILPLIGKGLLITAILILVARPLSVFISLLPFRTSLRKRIFISWVGLRGAVPIILATYPLTAGIGKAGTIFNLVFFISVVSVLLQGTTLPFVAKVLRLIVPVNLKKKSALDLELAWMNKSLYTKVIVRPGFECIGKEIVDLGLPSSIIIAIVERNNKFFLSDGATKLHSGDILYVMADNKESLVLLAGCLGESGSGLPDHSRETE